ncbi:MAG: UvrB/UvrC motif-containing protein [Elusimicrobia bacterium]|nr:UvrB/UvrC motif-containing protein [Elusimicrobiota bacterium]
MELGLEKSNPSLYKKVQSCIYLHTEECPAPCVQKISQKDYADIARKAADFFKGNIQSLKSEMEKEMKSAGEKLEFERAADLRDSLQSLQTVQEKVRIAEADETTVLAETELSRSLTELQEKLGLPYPPLRMEAFDISNIQGTEPVASMVVFELGKPLPSNYRKYKIKTVTGPNDFAMIAEVVRRRYRRLAEEGKKFPDLILIDGGKGQLSAALSALRNLKESGFQIPFPKFRVIALAKEFEEIYQENRKEPLRLPKDSPALRVLQWIRDEAHRFAVTFHRHRRENIF